VLQQWQDGKNWQPGAGWQDGRSSGGESKGAGWVDGGSKGGSAAVLLVLCEAWVARAPSRLAAAALCTRCYAAWDQKASGQ
jgi:hypothetical protein